MELDEKKPPDRVGYVYIRLKTYLSELEDLERGKPEAERRQVPTLTDLAKAAGVHKGTLSRLVTGKINSVNLFIARDIFDELYRRGFRPNPADLFAYIPPK